MTMERSARAVLEDHLQLANEWKGKFEEDLNRNFAADIFLLTGYGIYHGHDGVRAKAKLLADQLPNGRWTYTNIMVEGELGFLEWTAEADNGARVEDGADSYLIRDGQIHAMTIHYTVRPPA